MTFTTQPLCLLVKKEKECFFFFTRGAPHSETLCFIKAHLEFNPTAPLIHGSLIWSQHSPALNLRLSICHMVRRLMEGWVVSCPSADSWKWSEVAALHRSAESVLHRNQLDEQSCIQYVYESPCAINYLPFVSFEHVHKTAFANSLGLAPHNFALLTWNLLLTLLNLLIIHLSQWPSISSHFTSLCLSTSGGTSWALRTQKRRERPIRVCMLYNKAGLKRLYRSKMTVINKFVWWEKKYRNHSQNVFLSFSIRH